MKIVMEAMATARMVTTPIFSSDQASDRVRGMGQSPVISRQSAVKRQPRKHEDTKTRRHEENHFHFSCPRAFVVAFVFVAAFPISLVHDRNVRIYGSVDLRSASASPSKHTRPSLSMMNSASRSFSGVAGTISTFPPAPREAMCVAT